MPIRNEHGETVERPNTSPETVDEIVACLKRIRSSITLWTKEYGKRGYLDYVGSFFPSE